MSNPLNEQKKLAALVLQRLEKQNPAPVTELDYHDVYELLVAVCLSAQCTDKRVNMITPKLFEKYPTVQALSTATIEQVYELIKSISYPNNKAKHLVAMAQKVVNELNGQIPTTVEALEQLPGVGHKTASVVAGVFYGLPTMPVDTHVFRVSNRIGLTDAKNVTQSEKQLLEIIEPELLHNAHHWLILHGRYTCLARSPKCIKCCLTDICKFYLLHNTKTNE